MEAVDAGKLLKGEDYVAAEERGVHHPWVHARRRQVQRSVAGRAPIQHLHPGSS